MNGTVTTSWSGCHTVKLVPPDYAYPILVPPVHTRRYLEMCAAPPPPIMLPGPIYLPRGVAGHMKAMLATQQMARVGYFPGR